MNKKYILSKVIFASVLSVGILAGTLAFAQTTPASGASGNNQTVITPAPGTQIPSGNQNQNVPNNRVMRTNGFSGRGINVMPRNYYGSNYRNGGMAVWFSIISSITMVLVWIIMIEVIVLLFRRLWNHDKK